MKVAVDSIPKELRESAQWVNWRIEKRGGKPTKPPIDPRTGEYASTTDSHTWDTFAEAVESAQSRNLSGIGYVFVGTVGITGIDLDHCRNVQTGEIDPWANDIIDQMDSYTEISPSGDGVHILIRASMQAEMSHTKAIGEARAKVEIYDRERYFTVTGDHLPETSGAIESRQAEFELLYQRLFPPRNNDSRRGASRNSSLTDQELLDRAMAAANGAKLRGLWNGDLSEYDGDDSRADLALCCMLAFWTNKNPERIDALFRQSALLRPKWDRDDYRNRTIDAAISQTRETFQENRYRGSTEEGPTASGDQEENPNAANPPAWELYDMGDVEKWKTDQLMWCIENLIPKGGIGFLSGAPKDGKSLLSCDQMIHIAHGRPWLERFPTTKSQVLYIAREDPARRLKERILEINSSYGYGPIPRGCIHFLVRERFHLTEKRHIDWLYEQTRTREFEFIVLDVLNRMVPDLDESNSKDMARMVSILEQLNRELNLTIENIDHTRKPVGGKGSGRDLQTPNPFDLKGSIAKYGAADFMLCLSRTNQPGRLQLYAENKDTDDRPHFFIEVSPKGSTHPKFKFAGEVEKLSNDMKAKGQANRDKVRKALTPDWTSSGDLAKRLDMSPETVRKHLNALKRDGKAETSGSTKGTLWREFTGTTKDDLWESGESR